MDHQLLHSDQHVDTSLRKIFSLLDWDLKLATAVARWREVFLVDGILSNVALLLDEHSIALCAVPKLCRPLRGVWNGWERRCGMC